MTATNSVRSRFMRLIFDAETCEALELLLTTLGDENGFHEVLDCITAWQDLIDSEDSALRPLVECLDDDDSVVPQKAIALVNALIRHAPDEARAFRIKNELTVLDYKGHLEHLKIGADPKVLSEIQHFYRLSRFDNLEESSHLRNPPSEANEAMMPDDPLSHLLADLEALLMDESSSRGRILVVERVIEMLRGIRTLDDAEAAVRVLRVETPRKGLLPPSTFKASSPMQSLSPKASSAASSPSSSSFKLPDAPKPPPANLLPPPPPAPPPPPSAQVIRGPGLSCGSPNPGKGPPVLPPPPKLNFAASNQVLDELPESMKPKRAPSETLKMKTIMWSKITPSAVVHGQGSESIWGELARESTKLCLDFDMIDGMFAITPAQGSPAVDESAHIKIAKKNLLVDLLTPKRSQNVTITLKQFKDLDALISDLHENKVGRFDVEVLRTLRTILPDSEEVKALRRYTGECSQLAPACAFFLRLLDIPDYRLRIDCMILRLEFHRIMEEVVPGIHLLQMAATELRQSHALRRLLLLLVNIGNYLNSSSAHGNAAGFRLSSLWQVIDHKATKGSASLLHLLAKMDPQLLCDLEHELPNISRASESSLEEIKTNLRFLGEQCTSLSNQLKTKQDSEFEEIRDYLTEHCHIELKETNKALTELLKIQDDLALFFCENKGSFKIEECLKIFKILLVRLRQALQENEERERRLSRKQRSRTVDETILDRKDGQKGEEPDEEKFLATLEKGQKYYNRKRLSLRSDDQARERELQKNTRIRRLKEIVPNESLLVEDHSEVLPSKSSPTPSPLRTSPFHAKVSDLNDYAEILEKQQSSPRIVRRSAVVSKAASPAPASHQAIILNIPTESETSTPSARSSPKSTSDEGFESEKDKENSSIRSPSSTTITPPTMKKSTKPTEKVPERKQVLDRIPPKTSRPTVLVRPLTTASPPKVTTTAANATKAAPLTRNRVGQQISSAVPQSAAVPQQNSRPKTTNQTPSTTPCRPHVSVKVTTRPPPPKATPTNRALAMAGSKPPTATARPAAEGSKPVKKVGGVPSGTVASVIARTALASSALSPPARRMSTPHTISRDPPPPTMRRPSQATVKRAEGNRRDVTMKPQVSTSSRPSLIKTGSIPQSPNLPKMDAVEKPRPLRKTSLHHSSSSSPESTTSRGTAKPKWV
ncbi:FH2 domain-containing protein [Trichostrongylus colubriformis]|uniref:FH2 domain-containing protein n=1 Tax=Trichostrongylus colubriformis TaxID=6319 RepID=A0AAN8EZ94_TRICO